MTASAAAPAGLEALRRGTLLAGAALTPFNYLVGVPLGPATIRPLQLWAFALLAVELRSEPRALLRGLASPALLLWTTVMFVTASTLIATPTEYRARGLLDAALLAVNVGAFTVAYGRLCARRDDWIAFFRTLFAASLVASGALAARAMLAAKSGGLVNPDSFILGLGTVTGTFTTALAAGAVTAMMFASDARLRILAGMAVALHGLAAALTLARGPWLGAGAALTATAVVALWTLRRRSSILRLLPRVLAPFLLLLLTVGAAVAVNVNVARLLFTRLLQVANLAAGTGLARITLFRAIVQDAMDSPIFGHGGASYRRVAELLGVQGSVSENFVLEMFHAGGALALLPALLGVAALAIGTARAVRASEEPAVPLACFAGLLAMFLGALTNPAAWNTSFWVLLALCGTAPAWGHLAPRLEPARAHP